ncbi:MAG: hypothetical protein V4858_04215 [Pseudomonadota bacterium]
MGKTRPPSTAGNQRLSRLLAWACLALAVVLPVAALAGLLQTSSVGMLVQMGIRLPSGASLDSLPIAAWQHVLAVCTSLLPVVAVAYALLRAGQCFGGFVRGETISLATVRHLRGFAAGLLVSSIAGLLAPTAIAVLLTLYAPDGGRTLTLGLGSPQLLMLLFSGIVWQIGHAMTRAVELAEDNAQII